MQSATDSVFNIFINKPSAGRFFTAVKRHFPSSALFHLWVNILQSIILTGFVITPDLNAIYFEQEISSKKKLKSILSTDSIFSQISETVAIKYLTKTMDASSLILFMIALCIVCSLLLLFFLRFDIPAKIFMISPNRKNVVMLIISTIYLNYDLFFTLFNVLSYNCIPCRTIQIEKDPDVKDNYLETASFDIIFDVNYQINTQKIIVRKDVILMSNEVECGSVNHSILIMLGIILICLNFAIKMVSDRITKFSPSKRVFLARYGNTDLLFDMIVSFMMVVSSLIPIYFSDNYNVVRIAQLVYLILLLIAFFNNFYFQPFFSADQHNFKSFQILYLANLLFYSIIVREIDSDIVNSEVNTIFLMALSLTVLIKISDNVSKKDYLDLCSKINNFESRSEKSMLEIYYAILNYIDNTISIEISNKKVRVKSRVQLALEHLKIEHRRNCSKNDCFCHEKPYPYEIPRSTTSGMSNIYNRDFPTNFVYRNSHRLGIFDKKIENLEIFNLVILLEKLLEKGVHSHKYRKSTLFYCYLMFLIDYVGMPHKAYLLLQKTLRHQKKNSKSGKIDLTLEDHAVLQSIKIACNDNLLGGKLSLQLYPKLINETKIDSKKMQISNHIYFINLFQLTKKEVLTALSYRVDFLKVIRYSGRIQKCYRLGIKYYYLTQATQKHFDSLLEQSKRMYGPVLLVYSLFLQKVYQNSREASKIYQEYIRKQHQNNLIKVFSDFKMTKEMFSTIFVRRNEETPQSIHYVHQSLADTLGFTVEELEGEDLDILLPTPIKKFHRIKMEPKAMRGRMFMEKALMKTQCLDKKGYLHNIKIGLRYNCTIVNGLETIAIINTPLDPSHRSTLHLGKQFKIEEISAKIAGVIPRDIKLDSLNHQFRTISKSFESVSKQKLQLVHLHPYFDNVVFKRESMTKAWKIYHKWTHPQVVNLDTMQCGKICVKIQIQEQLIWPVKQYYFVASLEIVDRNLYENVHKIEVNTEKRHTIISYPSIIDNLNEYHPSINQSINKIDIDSPGSDGIHNIPHSLGIQNSFRIIDKINNKKSLQKNDGNKSQESMKQNGKDKDSEEYQIKKNFEQENILNSSQKTISKNMIPSHNEINSKIPSLKLIEKKLYSKSPTGKVMLGSYLEESISEFKFMEKEFSQEMKKPINSQRKQNKYKKKKRKSFIIADLMKNKKKMDRRPFSDMNNSSIVSSIKLSSKQESLESIIHNSIKPTKIHGLTISVFLLLLINMGLNLFVINYKVPIFEDSVVDLKGQLATADQYSWEILANLESIWAIDMMRVTLEGQFDPYSAKDLFNVSDTRDMALAMYVEAAPYTFLADKSIDQNIRTIKFPHLFNGDGFTKANGVIYFYQNHSLTPGDEHFTFEEKILSRNTMVKILDDFYMKRSEFNFSDPTKFFKIGQNRMLAIEEEYMRRNFFGDLNELYTKSSWDFYEYLKNVGKMNENYANYSIVFLLLFSGILMTIFICHLIREQSYMKSYYLSLFKVKNQDIEEFILMLETDYALIKISIREECQLFDFDDLMKMSNGKNLQILDQKENFKKNVFTSSKLGTFTKILPPKIIGKDKKTKSVLKDNNQGSNSTSEGTKKLLKSEIGQKKSNKKNLSNNVKVDTKGLNFSLFYVSCVLSAFLIFVALIQILYWLAYYPKTKLATTYIESYVLGIECWATYIRVTSALYSTIAWNNTAVFWGKPTYDAYVEHNKFFRENILDNYTTLFNKDLGSFTDNYTNFFFSGNSCETVFTENKHFNCYKYFNGLLQSNFYSSLTGILESLETLIESWKDARSDWSKVKALLSSETSILLHSKLRNMYLDIYYAQTIPSSNQLIVHLTQTLDFVSLYTTILNYCTVSFFIFFLVMAVIMFQKTITEYYALFYIFPFGLFEKNYTIVNRVRKIKRVSQFYKIKGQLQGWIG